MKTIGVVLAMLVVSALAFGEDAPKADVEDEAAYDVVVTTTQEDKTLRETGASVTVVTAEEMRKLETRSVTDALRTVPGLDVVQSGSAGHTASVFVRGTDANQMLVLLDGVPLNDPYFGGYEWTTLSTELVERIEVVRGPFSTLYGSDAIGGVVNIITRRGQEGLSFQGSAEGGSDGYGRVEAMLSGAADRLDYAVTGSWRDGDGTFENDDYRQTVGFAKLGVTPADGMHLGLSARVTDSSVGIPFSGTFPSPWRRYDTEERIVALPFTHEVSESFAYALELSHTDATFDYDDLGAGFPYASTTDATADRLSARGTWSAGPSHLAFGAEIERQEVDNADNFAVNLDGSENDSWGTYVQDTLTWDRVNLTVGVRYDDHDSFGGAVSPRASVAWRLGGDDAGVKLRAGYGEAFRAPSAGELYFPGSGNEELVAEESRSIEAGVSGHALEGRVRGDLTWFSTKVENLIDYEFSTFTFQNIGEARMQGVELGLFGDLGAGFTAAATYTKLDAEDEATGLPLRRRPDGKGSLDLGYAWEERLDVHARFLWVGDRPDIDPDLFTDVTLDGYRRLDLSASYAALPWLRPFARLENALDADYAEAAGFPAPGRTLVGGVRVTLP